MTHPQPTSTRVRIYSHITKSRFLHVEDTLNISKLRLFAGAYRRGQGGMHTHSQHYIDVADARILLTALVQGHDGFNLREYKGTPPRAGHPAISRILSASIKGDKAYIELKTGPGKLMPTGAITPLGKVTTEVNVVFNLYEAQRLAASVLAYIQAFDVLRMLNRQVVVSDPPPYLLVPTEGQATASAPQNNGATRPQTRQGNGIASQLMYGDGTPVATTNEVERQAFDHYRQANAGQVPHNKALLQAFYRQQLSARHMAITHSIGATTQQSTAQKTVANSPVTTRQAVARQ